MDDGEKSGDSQHSQSLMENFRSGLLRHSLGDVGYLGYLFIWCNHHKSPHVVHERLDRTCPSYNVDPRNYLDSKLVGRECLNVSRVVGVSIAMENRHIKRALRWFRGELTKT
ncbi:hypothetical protein Salat_1865500 [Sesamum alatum]|uniref:Uncharacterized protein n=1 Tax=Sesamum alatum TaxID=300844 RepID=A0AAE1Y348_9LAMI|nr:hypothetical protein Salat_1865500 [Sesamum alatum]